MRRSRLDRPPSAASASSRPRFFADAAGGNEDVRLWKALLNISCGHLAHVLPNLLAEHPEGQRWGDTVPKGNSQSSTQGHRCLVLSYPVFAWCALEALAALAAVHGCQWHSHCVSPFIAQFVTDHRGTAAGETVFRSATRIPPQVPAPVSVGPWVSTRLGEREPAPS